MQPVGIEEEKNRPVSGWNEGRAVGALLGVGAEDDHPAQHEVEEEDGIHGEGLASIGHDTGEEANGG